MNEIKEMIKKSLEEHGYTGNEFLSHPKTAYVATASEWAWNTVFYFIWQEIWRDGKEKELQKEYILYKLDHSLDDFKDVTNDLKNDNGMCCLNVHNILSWRDNYDRKHKELWKDKETEIWRCHADRNFESKKSLEDFEKENKMKTFEEKYNFLKKQGLSDFLIYQVLDWPIEAKKDKDSKIRFKYYIAHGFPDDAKYDIDYYNRLSYYQAKGFTEEAKYDGYPDITISAEKYFEGKKLLEDFEKGT